MKKDDELVAIVSYIHNPHDCYKKEHKDVDSIFSTILLIDWSGYYKEKIEEIQSNLDVESKADIFQIVSKRSVNLSELKRLLGYSYSTIHQHIHSLEGLKIIETKQEGKELKISMNQNIRVIPLSSNEQRVKKIIETEMSDSKKAEERFIQWLDEELIKMKKLPSYKNSTRK